MKLSILLNRVTFVVVHYFLSLFLYCTFLWRESRDEDIFPSSYLMIAAHNYGYTRNATFTTA